MEGCSAAANKKSGWRHPPQYMLASTKAASCHQAEQRRLDFACIVVGERSDQLARPHEVRQLHHQRLLQQWLGGTAEKLTRVGQPGFDSCPDSKRR